MIGANRLSWMSEGHNEMDLFYIEVAGGIALFALSKLNYSNEIKQKQIKITSRGGVEK